MEAQQIKVKSFSPLMEPMTVPMQRNDNNGNVCALVKVIIPSALAAFEGNLVGNCEFKTSEYWCYLSPGSKQMKVKYPNCEPLIVRFEPFIGSGLVSKQIYELHLEVPITAIVQNPQIYTISITAHSSKKTTILGKQIYEHMDSVTVKRYNKQGVYISSDYYDKGVLSTIKGEYNFQIGGVEGDKFEITAKGYQPSIINLINPSKSEYEVIMIPKVDYTQF